MRLTTRGKMAVTAITDLAARSHGHPVALPTISARQGISLSYLEDIFSALRRAGLVTSIRGPGGGYTLARPIEAISVADIVMASDRSLAAEIAADTDTPVGDDTPSGRMTAELWANFHTRVMDYLQSITVADLLAQPGALAMTDITTQATPARKVSPREPAKTQFPAHNVPNSVFALGGLSLTRA